MTRGLAAPIRHLIFGTLGVALVGCEISDDVEDARSVTQAAESGGLLQNGSFESGTSPWLLNLAGGASATFATDCSTSASVLADRWSYRVGTKTLGGDGAWNVVLRQAAIALGKGQSITVSFDAMSPVARTIESGTQKLSSPWTWYSLKQFNAPGDSAWHTYSWTYTQSTADAGAGFNIDLGQVAADVRIDNVVIRANGGGNLVADGSFENGAASWSLLTSGGAFATGTRDCGTSSTGPSAGRWSGKVSTAKIGTDGAWDVQLRQSGLVLHAGATVTVSFKARARANRTIEAGVQGLSSPWPWYTVRQFSLPGDGAWHPYTWSYTQSASDGDAAFHYDVGQATGDVWIDDVVTTTSGSACTPTTCAAHSATCGTISDGCGGTLSCGSCTSPQTCGGGGVANVCGGGGTTGGSFMPAPSGWSYDQLVFETEFGYSGMGSAPSAANQGTFVANGVPRPNTSVGLLNDWNFGIQERANAVWSRSGSFPYWGSSQAAQTGTYASGNGADYSFPGNVFQTSNGANAALFTGYTPQTFTAQGSGLTLQDHYVGGPKQLSIQSNGSVYYYQWSSAVLNTQGKRFFPFGGATEFFGQVKAKMAGPNNGSWSAIWMLPDQDANGTGQEIDIQEYNVSGANPYKMYAHVQAPAVSIGTGTSSTPLSAGYHVYAWHVNSATRTITVYLDGVQVGTYTGAQVGARYFLILDAAIASGMQDWQKQEGFVPNSTADMAMGVSEIQIYQR
jgi:hypothetical protein